MPFSPACALALSCLLAPCPPTPPAPRPRYYIKMAAEPSTKWVFFLQGGGLCVEPVDCRNRKESHLGSSSDLYWGDTYTLETDGAQDLLSDDEDANPEFHAYNHVFLPYCQWGASRPQDTANTHSARAPRTRPPMRF